MCYKCGKITPATGPRILLLDEDKFIYRVGPNGSTATAIDNGQWEKLTEWPGFSETFFSIKGRVNPKWIRWKIRVETKKIQRRVNRGGYIPRFTLEDAGLDGEGNPTGEAVGIGSGSPGKE